MVSVSVVVCTRNRGALIATTIESVLKNDFPEYELIVIDQSDDDRTEIAVKQYRGDSRIHFIRSDTVGLGASRNIGLNVARGQVVLYTDDDCRVSADWISTMFEVFVENKSVGMAFCDVFPGPHDQNAGFVPAYVIEKDTIVRSMKEKMRARGIGAGMAVRRSAARAIGGFDEFLGPGSRLSFPDCDDGDMAVRMILNGWWVYETNRTAVIHDGFRNWKMGRHLTKRNWTGIGAAYSKPLRAGHWSALHVILYEGLVVTLGQAVRNVFKLRKPWGVRAFAFFWYGFVKGLQTPIDQEKMVFTPTARRQ